MRNLQNLKRAESDDALTFALDHLTAIEALPADLFETARAAGYERACAFLRSIDGLGAPTYALADQPELLKAARRAIDQTGVTLDVAYPFTLSRRSSATDFRADLAIAAELGAVFVNALIYIRDEAEILDQTTAFCDEARAFGLGVAVEMVPATAIKTLAQASSLVRAIGRPGEVGVNLDALHLYRSGARPDDIAPFADDVVYVQLCDGPVDRPTDEWREEASLQRALPGRGGFDLIGFLDALPGLPVSIETPDAAGLKQGGTPVERALAARSAALAIIS